MNSALFLIRRRARPSSGHAHPPVSWVLSPFIALFLFLTGCAVQEGAPSGERASAVRREGYRPGLGTGWGEERDSWVRSTSFVRRNGDTPVAVAKIFYNDRQGVEAMLDYEGGEDGRASGLKRMATGLISVGLRDGSGHWLKGWWANGNRFVAGERGDRYEVVVRNETNDRLEIVLSVDGLDVMDGRGASFAKRGYIVHAHDTLTADGFRTSSSTVAAFRFRPLDRSYAALKYGDTRNVGVIGIAVFAERTPEVWRRTGANPFPGTRWATPPD